MYIISTVNKKGGAGKSTLTAHLSLEAVRENKKVILVDLDPQKSLEVWWEKRKETNPEMANISERKVLVQKIELMRKENFQFCFIDTPGSVSSIVEDVIQISDLLVIPCKPTAPDLVSVPNTVNLLLKYKKPFTFILNQAISKASITFQAAAALSKYGAVAPRAITNRVSYVNAMFSGLSAGALDKSALLEIGEIWQFIKSNFLTNLSNENEYKRKEKF